MVTIATHAGVHFLGLTDYNDWSRCVLCTYPTHPCSSTKAYVDIGIVQSKHHSLPWAFSRNLLTNRIPVQPSIPAFGGGFDFT